MTTKSGKHANKIVKNTLNSAANNGVAKAVDMRKVAALSAGAAGVIAGAAIAFGATPAMAADATSTPVKTSEPVKEQELTNNKKKAEAKAEGEAKGAEGAKAEGAEADASKETETSKVDSKANKNETELAGEGAAKADANAAEVVDQQAKSGNTPAGSTTGDAKGSASADANEQGAVKEDSGARVRNRRSLPGAQPTDEAAIGEDREAPTAPEPKPQSNSTVNLSKETKDTLPNMYAWGKSDNVYSKDGQGQEVKFKLNTVAGYKITKVAIFPNDNIDISNKNAKGFSEYNSGDGEWHQSYSGEYSFATNDKDGSATLTMSKLYRKGTIDSAQGYAANRSIYVYGKDNSGNEALLYKTNIARAATLIPPKKTGSIVLKYDEQLTDEQIRARLKQALDAPTEAKDGKSVREQIKDASQAHGVGVRKEESKPVVNTTDDPEKKIVITDKQAYVQTELDKINTVTSKADAKEKTYVTGVNNLKTYLVSDLGYKSEALALTVARYDTRIDKPIVTDLNNISKDVQNEIAKKLANLNHIPQDKVTVNADGTVTINFEGVDPSLAPKINLKDLVLKKLEEKDVVVPSDAENSKVKAVVVANPLGYSNAELDQIKKAIYEANRDNQELGLTSVDQISLGWISGDLTQTGDTTKGISNGQSENTITVTIKTDKAYAQFKSDIKEHRLTRLIDLRKDYKLSWDANKNKIDGRTSDEGLAWMEDGKTLVYRYDSDSGTTFNTEDVLKLLKATLKDDLKQSNPQMRTEILGSEYKTVAREGKGGKGTRSHAGYAIDDKGNPIGVLNLSKLNGSSYGGFAKPVDNSNKKMGDEQSSVNVYTFDKDSQKVSVAGKKDKCMIGRLFIEPYTQYQYNYIYGEGKYNPRTSPKGINVVFVPQTKHKTKDLKGSIDEHKTANVDGKDVPTQSAYYNASADKKKAYDDALSKAKTLYDSVKDTDASKLTEDQKADIDNATIKLNKARAELDGPDTNKDGLNTSIEADGKPAQGQTAASGTQATNQFKNVSDPDFKKADGSDDTERNEAAKKAKTAYDDALAEANKVKDDEYATQKAVDDAKAKLDEARKKLNDFTTNKDELNNAIAQHGHVNTGKNDQGTQDITKADPTYQNSSKQEQNAYDDAVAEANKVTADPNASQREVNKAIEALQKAKAALDANATDKSPLDAAVQKTLDNDPNKHSVFYTNAKSKTNDQAAKKAVEDYDKALAEAKRVLGEKNATKADVDKAKKALEDAEKVLYADTYQTNPTDLGKAIADNFSGYLMPAYFNAFDKAQAEGKDSQAAKDFKAYNDAYHAAKDLMEQLKKSGSTIKQTEVDKVKEQLIAARKIIDTYATDTKRLSAAVFNDIAIKASPAYQNMKALAEKTNPSEAEKADVEAAKKAMEAYKTAADKLHNAITNQLPKDQADGHDIPDSNTPKKGGDLNSKDYLKDIQAHKNGEPLNRDVDSILQEMNDAAKALDKFKTKTDDLINSINEDATTHPSPAFKNASLPSYKNDDGSDNTDKNNAAKKAVDEYGKALNTAKDLLNNPNATQKDINDAKTALDNARKALDAYKTDVSKLQESAEKHGKEKQGETPATEGTVTSDAYRNASDPHFLDAQGKPDDTRNKKAAADKKAYDEALTKAQELISKHNDANTPLDAQPTQEEIDKALKTLDEKRQALDAYKTDTSKLSTEANLSKADAEGSSIDGKFENTPEFKNADAKKKDGDSGNKVDNDDVKAYKEALNKARELVKAATDTALSKHPTQQQVDEALDALKKAKQTITDTYKTNASLLKDAKELASVGFKQTPEYRNAVAIKDDDSATAEKKTAAQKAVEALDENTNNGALKKAIDILKKFDDNGKPNDGEANIPTQADVDAALKTLQDAMKTVTDNFKTDATPLEKEVGDKDEHGNDVTPPFEATVEYKNALEQAKTEEDKTGNDSATKKLEDYNKKLKAAQELINKVNHPDPNAKPEERPTQAQVDQALTDLQNAKKAIDEKFKTNVDKLQNEVDDKNEDGSARTPKFEESTEYKNLKGKIKGDKKPDDLVAYEQALAKAKELIDKNDGKMTDPNDSSKQIDVPKDQMPTQQEVDEAKKALKEIKDKIIANYKTNPHDLQDEFDKSKDGKDDTRDGLFEDTPEFKNADAKKGEGGKDNADMAAYKTALENAKKLLDKFDRTTGKPKTPPAGEKAPTQKELDDALDALKAAKQKITDGYKTDPTKLKSEADKDGDFAKTPEFQNAAGSPEADAYKKALEDAKKVLGNKDATQAQVDEALKNLKQAKDDLTSKHKTDKNKLYQEMGNDPEFRKSIPFLIADGKDIAEYNKALNDANAVLADPNATQAQVDEALRKLQAIKQKMIDFYNSLGSGSDDDSDGDNTGANNANANANAVDKSMLHAEVNGALADVANGAGAAGAANGAKGAKGTKGALVDASVIKEFNDALENARRVLADPNATQEQVEAATMRLRAARAALNAAKANKGSNLRGNMGVQTGVDSATLSAFAAVFVGLAGLGVSAKRRKHASK